MPAAKPTKVFHIPGRFVHERLEDHKVESVQEAERLVATGAFALTDAEANELAYTTAPAVEADDSNVKPAKQPEEPAPEPAPEPSPEE